MGNDANGNPVYAQVDGKNQDEQNDNIVRAYIQSGRIQEFLPDAANCEVGRPKAAQHREHPFGEYAENWFAVFSRPNIEETTAITYRRQLDLHWLPAFGNRSVESITPMDIQSVLNGMGDVAKETRNKAIIVLRMLFDHAVEDEIIARNPAKARSIKLGGRAAKATELYTVEQMRYLVSHIADVKNPTDRAYLAIAALHPLRPEEVFGLQYRDIDAAEGRIHIRRAVTYPDRNQPVIKATKTEASVRDLDLVGQVAQFIPSGEPGAFLFGGDKPMSYQQIRRMRLRIQKDTGFEEEIVPRRFRTTVLTDLYEQTKDIKQTQKAAGHTTAEMTLKHYVRGRQENVNTAAPVASAYGLTS